MFGLLVVEYGRRIERRDIGEVDEVGGGRDANHFDVVIEVAIRNRCRADRIAGGRQIVRIQRLADVQDFNGVGIRHDREESVRVHQPGRVHDRVARDWIGVAGCAEDVDLVEAPVARVVVVHDRLVGVLSSWRPCRFRSQSPSRRCRPWGWSMPARPDKSGSYTDTICTPKFGLFSTLVMPRAWKLIVIWLLKALPPPET